MFTPDDASALRRGKKTPHQMSHFFPLIASVMLGVRDARRNEVRNLKFPDSDKQLPEAYLANTLHRSVYSSSFPWLARGSRLFLFGPRKAGAGVRLPLVAGLGTAPAASGCGNLTWRTIPGCGADIDGLVTPPERVNIEA